MAGLDPAIHPLRKEHLTMEALVRPAYDKVPILLVISASSG
jgi:hypothetical protein